ncbi:MAG TPA: transporter substrate-binding domain-containing protein [Burkholderiales bacterium]|nr:transporter substrate-binding domain-containing protein [Burkholderiales bacterium]
MLKLFQAAMVGVLMTGCATSPVPDAARAQLAPTGKLRAGMNLTNTLFTQKDANGQLHGVAVDVMNELGARLGVPVEMVVFPTPGQVADAVNKGTWDVAILAIEATRAQTISFSPPISAIEATYVVRKDSPLRSVEQVDSPGVRIAAPAKAGYELYLRTALKNATLVDSKDLQGSINMINDRKAEAMAALKPMLIDSMPKMPDARLLDGRFMTVNHGLSTSRGKSAADAYLKQFVQELNASGFIARSIERHGIKGLSPVN